MAAQGGGCYGEGVEAVRPMMIQRRFPEALCRVPRYPCAQRVCIPRSRAKLSSSHLLSPTQSRSLSLAHPHHLTTSPSSAEASSIHGLGQTTQAVCLLWPILASCTAADRRKGPDPHGVPLWRRRVLMRLDAAQAYRLAQAACPTSGLHTRTCCKSSSLPIYHLTYVPLK